jgi:hypothetical protein
VMTWCERGQRCSCWFDGWFGKDWSSACKLHDWRYMTSYGFGWTRKQADAELRKNVAKAGAPVMAWVIYVGVRLFGWYFWDKNAHKRVLNSAQMNYNVFKSRI